MYVEANTTDEQIEKYAAILHHDLAVANCAQSGRFFREYLKLERRVILMEQEIQLLRNQLAAHGQPAHLAKAERRG